MLIVLKITGLALLALLLFLLAVILYAASSGERIIESTDYRMRRSGREHMQQL